MKLPAWLQSILISVLLPLAKTMGKKGVVDWANKQYLKDADWTGTVIICLYRPLVVNIKPIAGRTDNDWDDQAVDLVIAAIQESATTNNVPLPDVTIKNPAPVPELPNP